MHKSEAALALADAFITEYRKYDFRFPSMKSIQRSKWWIHFERAAELRYLEDWNAIIWVKCQFEKNGKILPFQLYGKKAIDAFEEYKHRYIAGRADRKLQIISAMLSTHKLIKKWCNKQNLPEIDYEAYFKSNIDKFTRGQLSLYYLSICRPFMENFFPDQEDMDAMKLKRAWVHKNKSLKAKLQEIMGDDFY